MKALARFALAALALAQAPAFAATASGGDNIQVQDMVLTVPEGWTLKQDAKDEGTIILGFQKDGGAEYVTLYVKAQTNMDMKSVFQNGSQVVRDVRNVARNDVTWKVLETSKSLSGSTKYIASFLTEKSGFSYYGYSRTANQTASLENVTAFIQELR